MSKTDPLHSSSLAHEKNDIGTIVKKELQGLHPEPKHNIK